MREEQSIRLNRNDEIVPKRALIVSWNRMGDLLQLTPVIRQLHAKYPGIEIDLTVANKFLSVAQRIDGVAKVFPFAFGMALDRVRKSDTILPLHVEISQWIETLRDEHYDLVLNLTHNRLTALVCHLIEAPDTRGLVYDRLGYRTVRQPWSRFFFLANLNRGFSRINLVDIQLGIAGVSPGSKLNFVVEQSDRDSIVELMREQPEKRGYIAIQVGASLPNKAWSGEQFGEIAKRLTSCSYTPVFIGAPEEAERVATVVASVPGAINLCGKTSVPQLAAVLERSKLLLTNDTGTMHVAVCVGTRIVALNFGTALSHETGPYQHDSVVLEADISCYPCSFHVECLRFRCHEQVDVDSVWSVVQHELGDQHSIQLSRSVKAWRTAFDESGYWELRRVVRECACDTELMAIIWREVWKERLSHHPLSLSVANAVRVRFEREFVAGTVHDAMENLKHSEPALREILALATEGESIAKRLAKFSPTREYSKIVEAGKQLQSLDDKIHTLGLAHAIWRPLLTMFVSGKDAMTGNQVNVLAAQTAELYRELIEIGERVLELLNDTSLWRVSAVHECSELTL